MILTALRFFYGINIYLACSIAGWAWERFSNNLPEKPILIPEWIYPSNLHLWNFVIYSWLFGSILSTLKPETRFFRVFQAIGASGCCMVLAGAWGWTLNLILFPIFSIFLCIPGAESQILKIWPFSRPIRYLLFVVLILGLALQLIWRQDYGWILYGLVAFMFFENDSDSFINPSERR